VPISTLVTIDNTQVGPLSVSHQGQFPAVTISFNLPAGVALGQAIDAIQKAVADMGAPVTWSAPSRATRKPSRTPSPTNRC
jgi:HAE1 family hydrophobic/amphiphilic exporter-1